MPVGVASFVDGTNLTAEMLRRLAWLISRGDYGKASADSLVVSAVSPPSANVQIGIGSAVLQGVPAGVDSETGLAALGAQSYIAAYPAPKIVAAPPNTTGSPVTRRLFVKVRDPQFAGMGEIDPAMEDDYTDEVWLAPGVTPPPPYLLLATVTWPPNTAAVTSAMIVPEPKVFAPRTRGLMLQGAPPDENLINGPLSQNFPRYAPSIAIPSWATSASVRAIINSVIAVNIGGAAKTTYPPPAGGTATATARIQLGGTVRSSGATPPASALYGPAVYLAEDGINIHRLQVQCAAVFNVTALRGTNQMLAIDFQGTGAVAGAPNPWRSSAAETSVIYDVRFSEE